MRGYGGSELSAAHAAWSLDVLADDVLAVADAAGLDRVHLVGESIGGTIALYCAIRNPERVRTLTVSNGGHVGASIQRVQAWKRTIDQQGIKAWSDQFMRDRFHDKALDADRYRWYAAMQEGWKRDAILDAIGVLVGTDLSSRLGEVGCPALLMHPDGSPFIPVDAVLDLYKRLPDARLQVIAHARHGMPFSHAGECARLLRAFLDDTCP